MTQNWLAQIKTLDLEHIGNDFNLGTHVGSQVLSDQIQISATNTTELLVYFSHKLELAAFLQYLLTALTTLDSMLQSRLAEEYKFWAKLNSVILRQIANTYDSTQKLICLLKALNRSDLFTLLV